MSFVERDSQMSITQQCQLLGVPRSSYYHKPKRKVCLLDEMLMQAIDHIYMEEPTYGSRRIQNELHKLGHKVGRKRARGLMRVMGIEPIYPKPRLSIPDKGHKKYPYMQRSLEIERSNQVWSGAQTSPISHSATATSTSPQ
jgi:putative transposase